ncbi:tectonic-3-like [Limanda limanda]|uniref:tectonic-3-like n=1 Tax=Limanda limanda TaxID=27771 RepID=UPI0029C99094|nr:tectonic-3-like [Limanda limanda]
MIRWGRVLLVALCVGVANAVTDSGVSSTTGPTDGGAVTAATPAAGGTWDPTGVWTTGGTEAGFTQGTEAGSTQGTEAGSTQGTEAVSPEAAAGSTESPPAAPLQRACLCDLTPDFCDIGCCCDSVDCGVANLSTVFTGCPQKAISGVCIEKWLMFRANVDSSLVTETDSLFCVRSEDKAATSFQALPPYPALGASYHFSPPEPTSSSHSRPFYRVDDVIQTYFSNSSVRGLLRQPSPGAAASFCISRNPAKFLRSTSLSCTRMLTPQSCSSDPNLNARSYFSDLSLIKIPIVETTQVSDFLIPVAPLSEWPAPVQLNNSCFNVVEKVEFVIGYTGRGELTSATVNIVLGDVDPNQLLLQTHSVQFQLVSSSLTPGRQTPDGLRVGSPVIGRFDGTMATLTTLRSQGGGCSMDPSGRAPVLFPYNIITGCTFSSPARDCLELRSQIYGILQGLATPDQIAMNSGSKLNWTRVITQECPVDPQETCESGCLLPNSLSIQVLWARQGLLHLPQNYILGAKYIFKCRKFKCPVSSPLVLTTDVTFADTTVFPGPPRSSPRPSWKFPFGFFTRGSAELDGHVVINRSDTEQVTWSLVLFTVMSLTGLEFFTR